VPPRHTASNTGSEVSTTAARSAGWRTPRKRHGVPAGHGDAIAPIGPASRRRARALGRVAARLVPFSFAPAARYFGYPSACPLPREPNRLTLRHQSLRPAGRSGLCGAFSSTRSAPIRCLAAIRRDGGVSESRGPMVQSRLRPIRGIDRRNRGSFYGRVSLQVPAGRLCLAVH
jgi:hypothetical protein